MSKYDDLFDETAPENSVFADKSALDPFADPEDIVAREEQERAVARMLNGVHEGYLPPTVSIYGPPGTGKTMTVRRLCREFATRNEAVAVEYINLKESRTLFSAANEILFELTGEKVGAYEGLDGAFSTIWEVLDEYPEWTILLLDEIDQVTHDSNYDPNEFFYRLLRGEGKLARDIRLSCWLISNELLEVDLRLDSRVQSGMGDESILFPHYDRAGLTAILESRVEQAFRTGVISDDVFEHGITVAARRWGDARKAITLFRRAGNTANERGLAEVTRECFDANLSATDREYVVDTLLSLRPQHFFVLYSVTRKTALEETSNLHSVTTTQVHEEYTSLVDPGSRLSTRAIREILSDLETMGLIETWIQSRGREGRIKRIRPQFDISIIDETYERYLHESDHNITES
ncbi:Cdc6/Cdc18 family protein [Natronorarus salvus]|uniref:Cdc6/Cdc18 family protein n=1 Tax=Natronorarus salvus TaxID=3117733 RepID=UPI002F26A6F5